MQDSTAFSLAILLSDQRRIPMEVIRFLILYFSALNIIGFILMGLDKYKARKKLWRIPEATLFIIALIGGSIGMILGMYGFRHKTRHWYFAYGLPAILLLQLGILAAVLKAPIQISIM